MTKTTKTAKTTTGPKRIGLPDLAALVSAASPGAAQATVKRVVETTFEVISREFSAGNVIAIKDFGKFEKKDRPARKGRNPATGETIDIPAKTVPKFTFAKALKDA